MQAMLSMTRWQAFVEATGIYTAASWNVLALAQVVNLYPPIPPEDIQQCLEEAEITL